MIKKLLGLSPTPTADGAYTPSRLALKLATASKTNYDHAKYENPYTEGRLKILMLCTEEQHMTMANGKKFSTGNHPVEMFVPMLHFKNAGFSADVFTPTGQSVKIETWAMPDQDNDVINIYSEYKDKFENPQSLKELFSSDSDRDVYIAIFIPGGHGAMLGLPENEDVKKLLLWANQNDLLILSICHGPAVLLAASLNEKPESFIYSGYSIAAFPDSVDKQTPLIGYMPGHLTWQFGNKLKKLGMKIINKKADKTCYKDRNLITGASPDAANDFGKLAAEELLKIIKK